MNKKLIALVVFVLIAALSVVTIIAVAKTELAQFEIRNRTDQPVAISLTKDNTFYYLTVAPDSTKLFTVERLVYNHTTWACDKSTSGTLDITTRMHLTFTRCDRSAPNKGERGLEKVHIDDAPYGTNNRFTFTKD